LEKATALGLTLGIFGLMWTVAISGLMGMFFWVVGVAAVLVAPSPPWPDR